MHLIERVKVSREIVLFDDGVETEIDNNFTFKSLIKRTRKVRVVLEIGKFIHKVQSEYILTHCQY